MSLAELKAVSAFESSCQHLFAANFRPPAVEDTDTEGSPRAHLELPLVQPSFYFPC